MALSIADIGGLAPSSPGGGPAFLFLFLLLLAVTIVFGRDAL